MQTQPTAEAVPNNLLEIPLDELSEATKDFLIAHSSGGKSVQEVAIAVLDAAPHRGGFEPHKAA